MDLIEYIKYSLTRYIEEKSKDKTDFEIQITMFDCDKRNGNVISFSPRYNIDGTKEMVIKLKEEEK